MAEVPRSSMKSLEIVEPIHFPQIKLSKVAINLIFFLAQIHMLQLF